MSTSRRNLLAAGAGLAALDLAQAADAPARDVAELARLSAQGNAALMRGDIDRYMALVPLAPEFTLMSPFGGEPGHASSYTPERLQSIGRFFRSVFSLSPTISAIRVHDICRWTPIFSASLEM